MSNLLYKHRFDGNLEYREISSAEKISSLPLQETDLIQYADLAAVLPGQVALSGEPTYQNHEDGYYAKQQEELQPLCVVHPTSTAEVSTIVQTLKKHDVQFAIRCGGHSSNTGAANIQGGVTINLREMDKVTLNPDKALVSVPGGSKWHDVYSLLGEHGLATSGGRLSDVGVGGLSTGGLQSTLILRCPSTPHKSPRWHLLFQWSVRTRL